MEKQEADMQAHLGLYTEQHKLYGTIMEWKVGSMSMDTVSTFRCVTNSLKPESLCGAI